MSFEDRLWKSLQFTFTVSLIVVMACAVACALRLTANFVRRGSFDCGVTESSDRNVPRCDVLW